MRDEARDRRSESTRHGEQVGPPHNGHKSNGCSLASWSPEREHVGHTKKLHPDQSGGEQKISHPEKACSIHPSYPWIRADDLSRHPPNPRLFLTKAGFFISWRSGSSGEKPPGCRSDFWINYLGEQTSAWRSLGSGDRWWPRRCPWWEHHTNVTVRKNHKGGAQPGGFPVPTAVIPADILSGHTALSHPLLPSSAGPGWHWRWCLPFCDLRVRRSLGICSPRQQSSDSSHSLMSHSRIPISS